MFVEPGSERGLIRLRAFAFQQDWPDALVRTPSSSRFLVRRRLAGPGNTEQHILPLRVCAQRVKLRRRARSQETEVAVKKTPGVLALVAASLLASVASAQVRIEGRSPASVEALIGPPDARRELGQGVSLWQFLTAVGQFELFVTDVVTIYPVVAAPLLPDDNTNKADLIRETEQALANGRVSDAGMHASSCLLKWKGDGACIRTAARVAGVAAKTLTLNEPSREELFSSYRALKMISRVSPTLAAARAWLGQVEKALESSIQSAVDVLAERVSALRTQSTIDQAMLLSKQKAHRTAIASLAQLGGASVDEARLSIRRAASEDLRSETEGIDGIADLVSIERAHAALANYSGAVDDEAVRDAQVMLRTRAREILAQQAQIEPDSYASLRLLRELGDVAIRDAGVNVDDLFGWGKTDALRLPIALVLAPGTCQQLSPQELFRGAVALLPANVEPNAVSPAMSVAVSAECRVESDTSEPRSTPSSYEIGQNQRANPDYVQLQTELQAAQVNLADIKLKNTLNPPVGAWAGVAAGAAEAAAGALVARLQARIRETPPYLSTPVHGPYSYREWTLVTSATLTLRFRSGTSGTEISRVNRTEQIGRSGVMPSDNSHVANVTPAPPGETAVLRESLISVPEEAHGKLRDFIAEALIAKAEEQIATGDHTAALGHLLLARDVGGVSVMTPLRAQELTFALRRPLEEIHDTSFSRVEKPPSPPAAAPPSRNDSPGVSRAGVVSVALQSVATIGAGKSLGSAFFVSENGLLITNAHVVAGAQQIKVSTHGGDAYLASVVATETASDLALLRVKGWSGTYLEFAAPNTYDVGNDVVAIGSPLGLDGTVTRGIISAKRTVDGVKLLQIDAAINPGNSGGPLVDDQGRVVGVNTWKIRNERAESLGFAVSAETALKFLEPFIRTP